MTTVILTGTSAANSSEVTIPTGIYAQLLWLAVRYTSDATVGNRQIVGRMLDAAGTEIRDIHAGAVQAASLLRHYEFMPGTFRETAFVDGSIQIPFPVGIVFPPGYKIKILDSANISATDSFTYSLQYRNVAQKE